MTRACVMLLTLLALTACGVDGAPQPPAGAAPPPGVSVTGEARIGVVGTL